MSRDAGQFESNGASKSTDLIGLTILLSSLLLLLPQSTTMFVLGIFILLAVGLYLLVGYRHPKLPITFLRNDRGAEEKTRVLLLTAHPDDECMFFSPTILALNRQPEVEIYLLCVTKGSLL
jgi:hypothetical protein